MATNGSNGLEPAPADQKAAPSSAPVATPPGGAAVEQNGGGAAAVAVAAAVAAAKKPCYFVEPLASAQQYSALAAFKERLKADGLYALSIPPGFDVPADDKPGAAKPKPKDAAEAKRWAERQRNNFVPPPTLPTSPHSVVAAPATAAAAAAPAGAKSAPVTRVAGGANGHANAHASGAVAGAAAAGAAAAGAGNTDGKCQTELQLELELIRFLRARKFDVSAAYNMWKANLTWRRDERIDQILDVIDPLEDAYQAICPHSHHGFDKLGHPVYWEKTGAVAVPTLMKAVGEKGIIMRHVRYVEYVVRRMQHSAQRLGRNISRQVVVFDLSNLSPKPDPTSIRLFKETLRIDANYYPERLHQFFFINTPWYFRYSWAIVKPFLDAVTVAKFEVLSTDYHARLQQFIPKEQIPTEYGGTCGVCKARNPNGCIQAVPKKWVRPITEEQRNGLIVWEHLPPYGFPADTPIPDCRSGGQWVGPVPRMPGVTAEQDPQPTVASDDAAKAAAAATAAHAAAHATGTAWYAPIYAGLPGWPAASKK